MKHLLKLKRLSVFAAIAAAPVFCADFAQAQLTVTGEIDPPFPVEECVLEGGPDRTYLLRNFRSTEPIFQGYDWPTDSQMATIVSSCPFGAGVNSYNCLRLEPLLRQAAQSRDATTILTEAAIEFYRSAGANINFSSHISRTPLRERAIAFADLAVTGRAAYTSFVAAAPTLTPSLRTSVRARIRFLDRGHTIDDTALTSAISAAVQRAYQVAWTLRGPVAGRGELRAGLGWIAVSAEDDPPHRPVNIPVAPYPQDDIQVATPAADGTLIDVTARYYVATLDDEAPWTTSDLGAPPLERPPAIGVTSPILIYLHGLGSRAEEANDIIDPPHREGQNAVRAGLLDLVRSHGRRVTVISLDLPTRGYSTHVSHEAVAPSSASAWNTGYPWLDFNEEFVVRFVRAMEERYPGFRHRMVGVMGGSLGGNLTLRLSERSRRDPEVAVWARWNAAWSAASVWPSFGPACLSVDCRGENRRSFYDFAQHEAVRITRDKYNSAEDSAAKRHFLYDAIFGVDSIDRSPLGSQGSDRWYRNNWQPCKYIFRNRAWRDLNEVYSEQYRKWHFRGSHEQLIFSHQDGVGSELENPDARFRSLNGYLLFLAGAEDNHEPESLADNTQLIARGSPFTVQGEMIVLRNTGHSIHNERPGYLAELIVEHLLKPKWDEMDEIAARCAAMMMC